VHHTGINDTGVEFATSVNNTPANFATSFTIFIDTGGKFDKFATGVNNTRDLN
jgi:hypothetical protein